MVKIALLPLTEPEFAGLISDQNIIKLREGSLCNINIFKAYRRSLRGKGILDALSSLGRLVLPTFKRYIAPAAIKFKKGVATDIMKSKNLKNSLKTRGVRGLKQVGTTILCGKGVKSFKKNSKRSDKKNIKRSSKNNIIKRGYGNKKPPPKKINKNQ